MLFTRSISEFSAIAVPTDFMNCYYNFHLISINNSLQSIVFENDFILSEITKKQKITHATRKASFRKIYFGIQIQLTYTGGK